MDQPPGRIYQLRFMIFQRVDRLKQLLHRDKRGDSIVYSL